MQQMREQIQLHARQAASTSALRLPGGWGGLFRGSTHGMEWRREGFGMNSVGADSRGTSK